jgi:hypothetical protein
MNNKQLAKAITDKLFINGFGEVANRLVMESDNGKDIGGWCRLAVEDQIKEVLDEPT